MADDEEAEPPTADEGKVLSPDELDITDDERVFELDEGRYVISASGEPTEVREAIDARSTQPPSAPTEPPETGVDEDEVRRWIADYVSGSRSQYGFDITAKFEGSVSRHELFSDDVVTTFENLLGWYGHHLGGETPLDEVLGILLMESNVQVRYPTESLARFVADADLGPDDTIGDLLDSVEAAGGFRIRSEPGSRRGIDDR